MCVYAIHNNLSNINSLDELDIHAFYLFMFICVFFFFFKTGIWIRKQFYLPHLWPYQGFKDTVVIQALPSVHWGLLEITLTVPFKSFRCIFNL